jgi:hypothetical protein
MLEPDAAEAFWTPRESSSTKVRIAWYWNRLRCMSPPELGHRALRTVRTRVEHWRSAGASPPRAHADAPFNAWIHVPSRPEVEHCIAAAERIAAGRFEIFALRDVQLDSPPRWNVDPRTGVEAPMRFGKLINYRDPRIVGDIKYLWELNRHQHLVTLAQAHAITGEARYFAILRVHLESWLAACPCPVGPNWSSALEAGLRLISWSAAWQLLGGSESPGFADGQGRRLRERWLESVYQHARFIRGYFSLHSSANNHLIGEAAGLYIAAVTWPCWEESKRWRAEARRILEREIVLQNGADGVNREQAVAYQRYELELLVLCALAGDANSETFSAAFRARLLAMLEYIASIMDAGGNVPMIGDSDDAMVLRMDHRSSSCSYRALLATGAVLFRRGDFKAKAGTLDERTRWLVTDADAIFRTLPTAAARLPVRRSFPEGGYYILGCDFETPQEIRLLVDAGELGYQSIAAHGHADALSFWLSVGGVEFFVDPGTYAYHTQEAWRRYFRGTAAHNTVRIDGADQSESGGNFMWVRKARAHCASWSPQPHCDVFTGWHDGYRRLASPVVHHRSIRLDKRERRITIEDRLDAHGPHGVEVIFHCSEHCSVRPAADGYTVHAEGRSVRLNLPRLNGAEQRVYHGSTAPIFGWVSRRLDERRPAPTIVWRCRISQNVQLRTEILC